MDEVYGKGNLPDLGDRMEDVRLCRFPTTDSRQTEYPWQSPYAYYMNSPIWQLDVNGEGDGFFSRFLSGLNASSTPEVDAAVQNDINESLDHPIQTAYHSLSGLGNFANETIKTAFGTFTAAAGWNDPMGFTNAYNKHWAQPVDNLFAGKTNWENAGFTFGVGLKRISQDPLTLVGGEFEIATESSQISNFLKYGGQSFEQLKATRGGTETLGFIRTTNNAGKPVFQRISTEFSHTFITQRMQKAYKLPNWLVNNRFNVHKLNTIQHSIIDSQRYKFLRFGLKVDGVVGFGIKNKYNWFTKFPIKK